MSHNPAEAEREEQIRLMMNCRTTSAREGRLEAYIRNTCRTRGVDMRGKTTGDRQRRFLFPFFTSFGLFFFCFTFSPLIDNQEGFGKRNGRKSTGVDVSTSESQWLGMLVTPSLSPRVSPSRFRLKI